MPTDPEKVRLWGKTGSGLCTVKTARLTLTGTRSSPSFDDAISARPNLRRDSYTKVLGRFAIDYYKSFLRALDRHICGIRAFEDLSDVAPHTFEIVREIGAERR